MTEQEALKYMKLFRDEWDVNSKTKNAMALDVAIQALEKQIPKRVIYARTSGGQSGYLCPICENFLGHTIPNCCCKCGQRIELGE